MSIYLLSSQIVSARTKSMAGDYVTVSLCLCVCVHVRLRVRLRVSGQQISGTIGTMLTSRSQALHISEERAWSQYGLKRVRKSRPFDLDFRTSFSAYCAQGES